MKGIKWIHETVHGKGKKVYRIMGAYLPWRFVAREVISVDS